MDAPSITLGTRKLAIDAIPLGRLKKLVPAFSRAGRAFAFGNVDDATMDEVMGILSLATGVTVEELDNIPSADYAQITVAIEAISAVCGLKPKDDDKPGKAVPGADTPASTLGTPSTPD